MRVEIFANDRASFVKPMAEGLVRMLEDVGADARLHYDGLLHLMLPQAIDFSSLRSRAGSTARLARGRRAFPTFVERLRGADVIVIVANVPGSFAPGLWPNIELLRERLPGVPIVNYDLHYLPTLDSWARFLLRGERTQLSTDALAVFKKGQFGLEYQPQFFRGDREELRLFLSRVESGEVHSRLHEEHRDIGRNVNGSAYTASVST